jgi:allantoate deiminase
MTALTIDPQFQTRLSERIHALAQFSQHATALTRPSLTAEMAQANALVGEWMQACGMSTHEDNMGSLIGRYDGASPYAKTLIIGSHLDTVIDAGKYDGVLGVLLGLACVEHLAQHNMRLPFAIEVIAFCDEEGLRFHLPYLGSKTIAGIFNPSDLERMDAHSVTIGEAIRAYGGDPQQLAHDAKDPNDVIAYLEAHIEQGPSLEALDIPVGIVTGIAGQSRAHIVFTGEAGHAGTVPMHLRKDALVASAKFVLAVQETALNTKDLVATVGQLTVAPNASNAIPGKVSLSLDIRHQDNATRKTAYEWLVSTAQSLANDHRLDLQWDLIAENPSHPCAPHLVEHLTHAVEKLHLPVHLLTSGAGHDAVPMSALTEIAMLFVRCKAGISHNPQEFCASPDAEVALQVMLEAILALADEPL